MQKITDTFNELSKRFDNLPKEVENAFLYCVPKQFNLIEKLNREQLWDGERADNTPVKPDYTPYTVQLKTVKGQPTDRVTLKDTGAFYGSIKASVQSKSLSLYATDPKTKKLETKYKPEIIGLQDKNKEVVAKSMLPDLKSELDKKLLKK